MRIVIVDSDRPHADRLAAFLREEEGNDVVSFGALKPALCDLTRHRPGLVISELVLGTMNWQATLQSLLNVIPGSHLVVATSYPSIASAVRATRAGALYFAKPVTASALRKCVLAGRGDALADEPAGTSAWHAGNTSRHMSLDRAVWEIINQLLASSGSIAAASKRLGIDRRSLRRMLGKYPPPY